MDDRCVRLNPVRFLAGMLVGSVVASREVSPMCSSRGIPEPFGNAWTAQVRRRHAISATAGTDRG